ncbi:MAG: hypothetical protein IJ087_09715, partial [Eggerthellaceae bacterium]|nr:hypothetical protein [Eggerthellaceae bacterium]
GGLISRFNDEKGDPCVAIYHPDHRRDYNAYCVRLSSQGSSVYASVYAFGTSQQQVKFARSEYNKQARKRMTLGQKAINATVSGLINMGKSSGKYAVETDWYRAICEAIGFAIGQFRA